MEKYRLEIYQVYINERKKNEEVRAILMERQNLNVSERALKYQLGKWGYHKNIKRHEAKQILDLRASRNASGKESSFTLRNCVVDIEQVERHSQRARLHLSRRNTAWTSISKTQTAVVCRTPPPLLAAPLPYFPAWRGPEKLLHDIDMFIRGSFESRRWITRGDKLVLRASSNPRADQTLLLDFVANIYSATLAWKTRDISTWKHLQLAFENVDDLVESEHYQVIPELIRVINYLCGQGLPEVAVLLKNHMSACSEVFQSVDGSNAAIFNGLVELDITFMVEIEALIWEHSSRLFDFYLGRDSYPSFTMIKSGAARKLLMDKSARLDEYLPPPAQLLVKFGTPSFRTLDIISGRIEILQHRGAYFEMEKEASLLIEWAQEVVDPRLGYYYLIIGWFRLGVAQILLEKRVEASMSLFTMLFCESNFDFGVRFNAEKAVAKRILKELLL